MGAFANAEFRRHHSKVTKTVRISDEIRHSLQPHRNRPGNSTAESPEPKGDYPSGRSPGNQSSSVALPGAEEGAGATEGAAVSKSADGRRAKASRIASV